MTFDNLRNVAIDLYHQDGSEKVVFHMLSTTGTKLRNYKKKHTICPKNQFLPEFREVKAFFFYPPRAGAPKLTWSAGEGWGRRLNAHHVNRLLGVVARNGKKR